MLRWIGWLAVAGLMASQDPSTLSGRNDRIVVQDRSTGSIGSVRVPIGTE